MSDAEELLDWQLGILGLRAEREYRFHPTRRWRFDFAWPDVRLAVEVEGGTWVRGRHSRGAGFERDAEKYAEAMILGWTVLRVTPTQVSSGQAIQWIERLWSQIPTSSPLSSSSTSGPPATYPGSLTQTSRAKEQQ